MNTEQERADFEMWARKELHIPLGMELNWDNEIVQSEWRGWQARAALTAQPAAVDMAMMERIAALLYEETTGEPWTIADVKHYRFERDYYRRLALKVAAIVHARRIEGDGE